MEKMSVLIAELRENCQKLQTELLESKNNFTTNPASAQTTTVGVQVPQLLKLSHDEVLEISLKQIVPFC